MQAIKCYGVAEKLSEEAGAAVQKAVPQDVLLSMDLSKMPAQARADFERQSSLRALGRKIQRSLANESGGPDFGKLASYVKLLWQEMTRLMAAGGEQSTQGKEILEIMRGEADQFSEVVRNHDAGLLGNGKTPAPGSVPVERPTSAAKAPSQSSEAVAAASAKPRHPLLANPNPVRVMPEGAVQEDEQTLPTEVQEDEQTMPTESRIPDNTPKSHPLLAGRSIPPGAIRCIALAEALHEKYKKHLQETVPREILLAKDWAKLSPAAAEAFQMMQEYKSQGAKIQRALVKADGSHDATACAKYVKLLMREMTEIVAHGGKESSRGQMILRLIHGDVKKYSALR